MTLDDDRRGRPSSKNSHPDRPLELTGTTLRVYRYLYRAGRPCGIHDIQRGLKLSSSSVALYHVRKLLDAGLIREDQEKQEQDGQLPSQERNNSNDVHEEEIGQPTGEARPLHEPAQAKAAASGYVVDRLMFDNMIRIRRSLIPLQVAYAIFFATALGVLLLLLRPRVLSGEYVFALITIAIAIAIFSYQAIKAATRSSAI